MSFELVSQITLISSGVGLLAVISRKIPQLLRIPERRSSKGKARFGSGAKGFVLRLGQKIKEVTPLKRFSYDLFLQKILSRIRVLTLKTDSKTVNWLQKLREKTRSKLKEGGNYWEELKKTKTKR